MVQLLARLAAASSVLALVAADSSLNIQNFLATVGVAPASDPRFTNFVAPGPNDVRSPCPGLNALANHGFLHHDGRNMTIPHLVTGLAAGLNMGVDFSVALGGLGLLSSPDPLSGAFDLNDLDQHNFPIEHDSSLSRQDAYFGNDYSFYQPNWNQVLAHLTAGNATYTNLYSASTGKYARVQDSEAKNPTYTYSFREFIISYGETAIYLQTMGSATDNGVADLRYVRQLFEQEKLPYNLGWRPSPSAITLTSLGQMIFQLYGANPQSVPEGGKVLADSYKDVIELAVGGSEVLNNLTSGLAAAVGL